MSAYSKTSQGAYCPGASYKPNILESVDTRTQEQIDNDDPEVFEDRYYCQWSSSIEVKFDTGNQSISQSASVRLVGADGNDYKLSQWTAEEQAVAMAKAYLDADVSLKTDYGISVPTHGAVTTTIG
tara:strand:+ start:1356 stop:1733 length:378 start_codon:yes stop_codon:yes gene_type:complete